MSSDKTAEYAVTADPSGFQAGMEKAISAAKDAQSKLEKSFSGIGDVFKDVQSKLFAFTAILGGGAFMKDAIGVANKLNGEAMGLAKSLGITGSEAATLRTALGDIGSDSDTYIGAFQKFAKQVKNNEDGLKAMGLKTRDSNGHLRDSNTLFTEALQVVGQYKPGLDQTTAAMEMFGKGVNEVMALQKLNNKVLDDAEQKNKDYGMALTNEGVQASKEYKAAMNDLGDVFEGIKNTIGQAFMPIVTRLSEWFAEVGPATIFVFKTAIDVVATAIQGFIGLIRSLWDLLRGLVNPIFEISGAFKKLIQGDMNGATAQMQNAFSGWGDAIADGWGKAGDDLKRTAKEVSNLWGQGTSVKAPKAGTNTVGEKKSNDGKELSDSLKAQSAVIKAELEGQLSIQKEYLTEAQEAYNDAYKHNLLTTGEFYVAKLAIEQQGVKGAIEIKEEELRQLHALQEKAQKSGKQSDILGLRAQELKLTAELTVLNAKAFDVEIKNTRELTDALQQKQIAMLEIARVSQQQVGSAQIDRERIQIEEAKALRQMSDAEVIQAETALQERLYKIDLQALQAKEQQFDGNLEKIAANNAAIEQLERTHQTNLQKLKSQTAIAEGKNMADMYGSIQSGLQGVIKQAMQGSLTLKSLFQGVFQAVANAVGDMLAKTAAQWLMDSLLKKSIGRITALSQVTENAGVAGSAAVASTAAIPITGPALAPAAGAAAFSAAMAFAPMASARGGYDIPAGVNPITQLHEREMVLPQAQADAVRNMAGGGGGMNVTVNVTNSVSDKAEASVQPRMNSGKMEIDVMIRQAVTADQRQNGPMTQGFANTFGLARAV